MSEADYLDGLSDGGANDPYSAHFAGTEEERHELIEWFEGRRQYPPQSSSSRSRKSAVPKNKKGMAGKYSMKCHCGTHYEAKGADLGRGWGFSCSKRCSAVRREFGKPKAQILGQVNTPSLKQVAKKHHTTEVILVDRETGEVIETNKY